MKKSYQPKKDLSKYIGLDTKDIPGTSPTKISLKGLKKRGEFFPHDKATNAYYNREAQGVINSEKGYIYRNDSAIKPSFNTIGEEDRFKIYHDSKQLYDPKSPPINPHKLIKEDSYTLEHQIQKYNEMSPFDRIHNKRHDWRIPVAISQEQHPALKVSPH